jgi:hypothetical protein
MSKATILTPKEKEKAILIKEAKKAIARFDDSGLSGRYIAGKLDISETSISKFFHLEPTYVTRSMIDRLNAFADEKNL